MYIDKLNDIVAKYNNTYHRKIKMKLVDVKDNPCTDFKKDINDKNPEFKDGDHLRNSKYKNIFAKVYTPNSSKKVFVVSKIKNTIPWTYVINDLMVKKLLENFMKKNYKRLINKNL